MLYAATKQDMQGAVEYAKNAIMERMASKSNLEAIADQLRANILQNLNELHAENQQLFRQSQARRDQLLVRVANLEQELRTTNQLLGRLVDQQNRLQQALQRP